MPPLPPPASFAAVFDGPRPPAIDTAVGVWRDGGNGPARDIGGGPPAGTGGLSNPSAGAVAAPVPLSHAQDGRSGAPSHASPHARAPTRDNNPSPRYRRADPCVSAGPDTARAGGSNAMRQFAPASTRGGCGQPPSSPSRLQPDNGSPAHACGRAQAVDVPTPVVDATCPALSAAKVWVDAGADAESAMMLAQPSHSRAPNAASAVPGPSPAGTPVSGAVALSPTGASVRGTKRARDGAASVCKDKAAAGDSALGLVMATGAAQSSGVPLPSDASAHAPRALSGPDAGCHAADSVMEAVHGDACDHAGRAVVATGSKRGRRRPSGRPLPRSGGKPNNADAGAGGQHRRRNATSASPTDPASAAEWLAPVGVGIALVGEVTPVATQVAVELSGAAAVAAVGAATGVAHSPGCRSDGGDGNSKAEAQSTGETAPARATPPAGSRSDAGSVAGVGGGPAGASRAVGHQVPRSHSHARASSQLPDDDDSDDQSPRSCSGDQLRGDVQPGGSHEGAVAGADVAVGASAGVAAGSPRNSDGTGSDSGCDADDKASGRRTGATTLFRCHFAPCSYSTHVRASLVSHVRTHTHEKRFFCSFEGCDYGECGGRGESSPP